MSSTGHVKRHGDSQGEFLHRTAFVMYRGGGGTSSAYLALETCPHSRSRDYYYLLLLSLLLFFVFCHPKMNVPYELSTLFTLNIPEKKKISETKGNLCTKIELPFMPASRLIKLYLETFYKMVFKTSALSSIKCTLNG